jgi:hypothetical protein
MKLGVRNLPKYLVERIGKDRIVEALNASPQEFVKGGTIVRTKSDYSIATYRTSKSTATSKKKWKNIQDGLIPPDPLYSVEDALAKAGLS